MLTGVHQAATWRDSWTQSTTPGPTSATSSSTTAGVDPGTCGGRPSPLGRPFAYEHSLYIWSSCNILPHCCTYAPPVITAQPPQLQPRSLRVTASLSAACFPPPLPSPLPALSLDNLVDASCMSAYVPEEGVDLVLLDTSTAASSPKAVEHLIRMYLSSASEPLVILLSNTRASVGGRRYST